MRPSGLRFHGRSSPLVLHSRSWLGRQCCPTPQPVLGTLVLPGTRSACRGPSPQPGTRGLPQPWPRAARGNKGPVSACSAPHPLACPWHRRTRAQREPKCKSSTRPFAEAVRSPLPPSAGLPAAQVFPHSKDGHAERGVELGATHLGLEPRSLCRRTCPQALIIC